MHNSNRFLTSEEAADRERESEKKPQLIIDVKGEVGLVQVVAAFTENRIKSIRSNESSSDSFKAGAKGWISPPVCVQSRVKIKYWLWKHGRRRGMEKERRRVETWRGGEGTEIVTTWPACSRFINRAI